MSFDMALKSRLGFGMMRLPVKNGKFHHEGLDQRLPHDDRLLQRWYEVIFKIERIDIPENDEERVRLSKQNFKNTAEDAYTG